MGVYDDIDKNTVIDIIDSLVNINGAENGITLSQEFLKSLLSALNNDEQNDFVKWHPYPEEIPNDTKQYLLLCNSEPEGMSFCKGFYDCSRDGDLLWHEDGGYIIWDVIYWAELPVAFLDKKSKGTKKKGIGKDNYTKENISMNNTKKRTFIRVTNTSDTYEDCGNKSTYIDASLIYKIVDGRCGSTIFYDDLGYSSVICVEESSEEVYKKIRDVTNAENKLSAKEYEKELAEFYNRMNRSLL